MNPPTPSGSAKRPDYATWLLFPRHYGASVVVVVVVVVVIEGRRLIHTLTDPSAEVDDETETTLRVNSPTVTKGRMGMPRSMPGWGKEWPRGAITAKGFRMKLNVGTLVAEAIDKMDAGDPEGALYQICSPINATATLESGASNPITYKEFIHQNLGLITGTGLSGLKILNLNIPYDHPRIPKDANGLVSLQSVLYHAVRCNLYHEASMPSGLKFTDEMRIHVDSGNVLVLPSSLIYGLIIAVVVSPVNCNERVPKNMSLNLRGYVIPINNFWGRRAELLWLMDAVAEVARWNTSPPTPA